MPRNDVLYLRHIAVKRISSIFRGRHGQIPWQDIACMRDKLIHHYFGVNIDQVWLTVREGIPLLKSELLKIVPHQ